MKITKEQLTQIIKEEIAEVLNEMPYRGPGYRYTKNSSLSIIFRTNKKIK